MEVKLFSGYFEETRRKTMVIEMWALGVRVKAMPKIKELQANNPDVDYVFISMDKTADKWITGIDKHELKGDHFMANDQQQGVFGSAIDLD
jgi:hypothetical protein